MAIKDLQTPSLEMNWAKKVSEDKQKEEEKDASKLANLQTSKLVSKQTSKLANSQTSKPGKKFGTYLPEETIRRLKHLALDTGKKEYQILHEALDHFLKKNGY